MAGLIGNAGARLADLAGQIEQLVESDRIGHALAGAVTFDICVHGISFPLQLASEETGLREAGW
ncbi:MAG: hypothetical protein WAV95_17050 [Azonexus sp.]